MHLLYVGPRAPDLYLISALREIGHVLDVLDDPGDAPVRLAGGDYDVVILDLDRPDAAAVRDLAGVVGRALLLLIVDRAEDGAAAALRAGADACLERPVQMQEMQERLRALMRLGDRARLDPSVTQALETVRAERVLVLDGRRAPLSPLEVQVVAYMLRRAGEVVSAERLHAAVWGDEAEPDPERVRATLGRLRRKLVRTLGLSPLEPVAGQGYVLRLGAPKDAAA